MPFKRLKKFTACTAPSITARQVNSCKNMNSIKLLKVQGSHPFTYLFCDSEISIIQTIQHPTSTSIYLRIKCHKVLNWKHFQERRYDHRSKPRNQASKHNSNDTTLNCRKLKITPDIIYYVPSFIAWSIIDVYSDFLTSGNLPPQVTLFVKITTGFWPQSLLCV